MRKTLIILLHVMLSSFGHLEYCFSRGIRKFRFNLNSHYSCRINQRHPAYQDISISISKNLHEPRLTSHMLCKDLAKGIPNFVTGTLSLN
jgi:hypothetical protein